MNRVAGTIEIKANNTLLAALGSFSINLGFVKREGLIGSNSKPQGYKEAGQIPYIKGMVRDLSSVSFTEIANIVDATITLKAANGKTYMWEEAYYSGDGEGNTEEGSFQLEFEASRGVEI